MLRSMWKDGECNSQKRRNSPRLSALNLNKETQERKKISSDDANEKIECKGKKPGPPSRAKGRAKRKFPHLAAKQVSEHARSKVQKHEHQSTSNGVPTKLPEKRLLELIIDILQRRDAYEIFAEPVDPHEVEDYNEIIKEPMDFGTMRAKLHEGMYENLEQFEHDAFLIPENAMHFNPSGTIYFRQARCIQDLAKKVFHVLRTDPKNLEMEFAGTRRRSMRKMQNESKESKPQKDVKAGDSSNNTLFCFGAPSALAGCHKRSPLFPQANNNDRANFHGAGDEDSRRSTYKTWNSSLGNDCKKTAILSSELNMNYRESLMKFVQDLGPTAMRVAGRKLQALNPNANISNFQSPPYQVPTAYATFKMPSFSEPSTAATASNPQTGLTAEGAEMAANVLKDPKKPVGTILQYKRNNRKVSEAEKSKKQVESHSPIVKPSADLNSSTFKKTSSNKSSDDEQQAGGCSVIVDTRKPDEWSTRPIVLALEQSFHPNAPTELKTRNKRNKAKPPRNKSIPTSSGMPNSLEKAMAGSQPPHLPPRPLAPRFAFDMPFLRSQLSQMNPATQTWGTRVAGGGFGQQSLLYDQTNSFAVGGIGQRSLLYDQTNSFTVGGIGQRSIFDQSSRYGSLTSLLTNPDEQQQVAAARPFFYSSNNNYQPSWHSSAPPSDSNLSLHL
ncbi:hypothetical protein DM860_016499 [Cuscuta australis]|uniref:Bromo domain-containing protein n=1 Tax=Cuscuta australis TaxID=267555 RepID=A0A328E6B4_9ASTE|nr:hypothetical protein DM860_016499 [Cuscuta australis]